MERLSQTDFESKIALHYGEIMYYQNTSDEYYEYTMIGNALTNLFRLESVSLNNSINFFSSTPFYYMKLVEKEGWDFSNTDRNKWEMSNLQPVNLQGVSNKYFTQLVLK